MFFCGRRKKIKRMVRRHQYLLALTSCNKVKIPASILLLKASLSNKNHKNTNNIFTAAGKERKHMKVLLRQKSCFITIFAVDCKEKLRKI